MSNPSKMSVEASTLSRRSSELVEPLGRWPGNTPEPPNRLVMTSNAIVALQRSVDNMAHVIRAAQEEWLQLARLLIDAATAYRGMDEDTARRIKSYWTVAWAAPEPTSKYDLQAEYRRPPPAGFTPQYKLSPLQHAGDYYVHKVNSSYKDIDTLFVRVREAADQIHYSAGAATPSLKVTKTSLDPNANAWSNYADAWHVFSGSLVRAEDRFRRISGWRGDASDQAHQQFELQLNWLRSTAQNCRTISEQSQKIADAHRLLHAEHPTPGDVAKPYTVMEKGNITHWQWVNAKKELEELQKKSEEVLRKYRERAGMPLAPLNPAVPPRVASDFKSAEQKADEKAAKAQTRSMEPIQAMLKAQREETEKARAEARKAQQEAREDAQKARQEAREEAQRARQEAQEKADEAQAKAQEMQKSMTSNFAKSMNAQQAALAKSIGAAGQAGKAGMPKVPSVSKLMGTVNQFANMAKGMAAKATPPVPPGGTKPGVPWVPPLPAGGHVPNVAHGAGAGGTMGGGINIPVAGAGAVPSTRVEHPLAPPVHAPVQGPGLHEGGPRPAPASELAPRMPGSTSDSAGSHVAKAGAMPPMPGMPPQDQNAGKAKRVDPDDSALYTEERPWTEGVIGRRPRKVEPVAPPPEAADGPK